MKLSRILGVACFGVLFVPLQFAQAQQSDPRKEAENRLKDVRAKLSYKASAEDALKSLELLEEITIELRATHHQLSFLLHSHRDPQVRKKTCILLAEVTRGTEHAPDTVKLLSKATTSRDIDLIVGAYMGLTRLGTDATAALPTAR